ncbi:SDR family oxidoreductase [soil metagenome]
MRNPEHYTLITGATSGIGYELAKLFAKGGHNLILVARTQRQLEKVTDELLDFNKILEHRKISVIPISQDLFDPNSAFQLYEEIKQRGLIVDNLVNSAGQGLYGEFIDTDIQKELNIIQLNISSLVVLTKLFLKDMVRRGFGRILNLSSVASRTPGPLQAVYHGTKAFVQSFTEAICDEVKDSGVTITALLPGATATDFYNKADMLDVKNLREGKLARPADVARDGFEALMKGDDMVVSGFGALHSCSIS